MEISNERIHIKKTARVSVLGGSGTETTEVWLLVHGYGQLSHFFIQSFQNIASPSSMIIAPEGLHRFYIEGFSGRVGASWMTTEERLVDIEDYLSYLDAVYDHYVKPLGDKIRFNVLGFSQGTATVCRWVAHSHHSINNLILWAGMMPPDLDFEASNRKVWPKTFLVRDPNDIHQKSEHFSKQLSWLKSAQIVHQEVLTQDGHRISENGLQSLLKVME
jgi:predicted esterase